MITTSADSNIATPAIYVLCCDNTMFSVGSEVILTGEVTTDTHGRFRVVAITDDGYELMPLDEEVMDTISPSNFGAYQSLYYPHDLMAGLLDFYSDMKRESGMFLPYKRKIVMGPILKRRFWRRAMIHKSGFLARKGKMRKRGKK